MSLKDVIDHLTPDDRSSESSSGDARNSLLDDFFGSMKEFSKGSAEPATKGGSSEIGDKVGDLTITGVDKGDDHTGGLLKGRDTHAVLGLLGGGFEVDKSEQESLARRYETIARTKLEQAESGLQYTTDGSTPKKIEFQENFALATTQTLDSIARSQLGSKAASDQINAYVSVLQELNGDKVTFNASGDAELPAGPIALPGQTEQGAIVYEQKYDEESTHITCWNNGNVLRQYEDGTFAAQYLDGGADVVVTWNANDVTQNNEERYESINGHTVETRRKTDSQGRQVETHLEDGAVTSVKVTDKASNIYEFRPGKDGELQGQKTNRGTVVDNDVWMTENGRIYKKEINKVNEVTRKYEDGETEKYDRRGRLVERTWQDDQERSVVESYKPGKSGPNEVTLSDKDGNLIELKLGRNGDFYGTKRDGSGAVVDAHVGMLANGTIFSRTKEADGTITRSFEDGFVEKLDKRGNTIHIQGVDEMGRKFSSDFKPGETEAQSYELEVVPGQPLIEFKRNSNNEYVADHVSPSGTKIGTMELVGEDILFRDNSGQEVRTLRADGVTVTKKVTGSGKSIIESKDGEYRTVELDANGQPTSETWSTRDRSVRVDLVQGAGDSVMSEITIQDLTDGSITKLKYDEASKSHRGERAGSEGKEDVVFDGEHLFYFDSNGDVSRTEKFIKKDGQLVPKIVKTDYDPDAGILTRSFAPGGAVQDSYSPGRSEIVAENGHTTGESINGYRFVSGPGSATMVYREADQTGVMVGLDGKVTIWDKSGTRTEQLSSTEESFLKSHPELNRCDAAELHRRLSPDQGKIDAFYETLSRIETAENLTPSEKTSLQQNLVRHVAFPAEIYQGSSPTCNVSVIQRELAMTAPDKYADFVIGAANEGRFTTSNGREIRFNRDNLKISDSSGRDLASRIFQTAAVNVILYPKGEAMLNSQSGAGEIRSIRNEGTIWPMDDYYFTYGSDLKTFQGLSIDELADAMTNLTGEPRGGVWIDSAEELVALYRANGNNPLTLAVDGSAYPFDNAGPVGNGKGANHVVSIVGVDQGPPLKFLVQNQWGLQSDHSSLLTAIDADDLMFNITAGGSDRAYALGRVPTSNPTLMYDMAVKADGNVDLTRACTVQDDPTDPTIWNCV